MESWQSSCIMLSIGAQISMTKWRNNGRKQTPGLFVVWIDPIGWQADEDKQWKSGDL